jgi:hypothetical protein
MSYDPFVLVMIIIGGAVLLGTFTFMAIYSIYGHKERKELEKELK